MLHAPDFENLAIHLQDLAVQERFQRSLLEIGPLSVELNVDPSCADLDFNQPFFAANDGNLISTEGCFRVFVTPIGEKLTSSVLQPFLTSATYPLDELTHKAGIEQFFIRDPIRKILKVFDIKNRMGLMAYADIALLPPWEWQSPIKDFIHLYALANNCLLFHGASLVRESQPDLSILITGPGGSGKSTLTAHALDQGMRTNGDDYVLLDFNSSSLRCWAVYRTLKLHPSSPAIAPRSAVCVWKEDALTGKWLILGNGSGEGGSFVRQSTVTGVYGVILQGTQNQDTHRGEHQLQTPHKNPYLYSCMSTIQQMPYRIDKTLKLIKQMHQTVPFKAHVIGRGLTGLESTFDMLQGQPE